MTSSLKNVYPGVTQQGGVTLGGKQQLLTSKTMQHCGCGVVAALDLIRYLHLYDPACRTSFFTGVEESAALPVPVYDLCAQRMRRNYLPVIYPVGTTGFSLAGGLNRYFKQYGLPLKAKWGVPKQQLWQEIQSMLDQDLPVILSVGNHFPKFWDKRGAVLHLRSGEDWKEASHIHAHYAVVLAMDETWLRISSWGREYYLARDEFLRYRDSESLSLLCNIVWICRKEQDGSPTDRKGK